MNERAVVDKVPLPADLSGKRCLDMGSDDEFWAAEMRRRGAYEVLAPGVSVVDLDPTEIGHFDVVLLRSVLGGLRDPVLALERVRSVCAGIAVIVEAVELVPSLRHPRKAVARLEGLDRPNWWHPNRAALLRMIRSAGFEIEQATQVYFVPLGEDEPAIRRRSVPLKLLRAQGREQVVAALKGVPHVAVRARP